VKVKKPTIIAILVGIVLIGTASLYVTKFLTDFPAKASVKDLLSTGKRLFEKKQYDDAHKKLEECYQKAPDGELKNQAILFLSRCFTAQNQKEKAITHWNKVIENSSMRGQHAEAYYSLGLLQSAEEERPAEEYYNKAIASEPGSRFADLAEIELAKMMMEEENLRGAQQILEKLRDREKDYPQLTKATFRLNMTLLFSPTMTEIPESQYYRVKEGDTLDGIARTLGTTAALLQKSNRIADPRKLQIGQRLKVVTGKFQLEVSKSKNVLQLLSRDMVLNEYRIGTGKFGNTPVGKFKIGKKIVEPPWFPGDGRVIPYGHPENVLGTRWMGLEDIEENKDLTTEGIGIHGTHDESTIGKESSQGCIRLLNRDVEELFDIIPKGTEVIIKE